MPTITSPFSVFVNYGCPLQEAIQQGGFTPFRMPPLLMYKDQYEPRSNQQENVNVHTCWVPSNIDFKDIPRFMQTEIGDPIGKILRPPRDIREVLALGPTVLKSQNCGLVIIAPLLVDSERPDLVLKLYRYPEWMGLIPNMWDPDFDNYSDHEFVMFSH